MRRSSPAPPRRCAALHQYPQHWLFRRCRNFARRRFSAWGELGYQASIFICLARFRRRPFPLIADGWKGVDRRPCLFLTFSNSKYTGGTMMVAPGAETDDGLIEYVRWGPIGRIGLIHNLPR